MARLSSQLVIELLDRVSGPARKVGQSLSGITKRIRETNAQRVTFADRLDAAMTRNNRALEKAHGGLIDAVDGFYVLKNALGAPMQAAADFESQLENIGQKANIPQEQLSALGERIKQVALGTNQASSQIASAVDALVGRGAGEDVALAAANPIGKAATAYRAATDDLASAAWAAVDNLKVPAGEIETALDMMAQAGKEGAFELRDMAQYFPALGASYQALGQEGTDAVADLAAALQVVRKGTGDSSSAATNLGNVLQKIYAPATVKKFGEKGVDVFKAMEEAASRGLTPIEAIAEISNKALDGDLSKMGTLFEDAQVQAGMRALIQNMDEYRRIREAAVKASGVVEEDFARRLKTAQGAMDRWKGSIENLNIAFGTALLPLLNDVLDKIIPVINKIGELAAAYPDVTSAVVGATAALIGFRIAATSLRYLGLVGKGGILEAMSLGLRGVTGAGKATTGLFAKMGKLAMAMTFLPLTRGVRSARRSMDAFRISAAMLGTGGALRMIATGAAAMANPLRLAGAALRVAAGGMRLLTAAIFTNPIGIALGGLILAGKFIYDNWSGLKEMFAGFKDGFLAAIEPLKPALEPIGDLVKSVADWFADLSFKLDASPEDWRRWGGAVGEVVAGAVNWGADMVAAGVEMIQGLWNGAKEKFDEFLTWVKGIPDRIMSSMGRIDLSDFISWKKDEEPAPAPLNAQEKAGLSGDQSAAVDKLTQIRQSGSLPTQSEMDDLILKAEALKKVMDRNAELQRKVSQQYSAEDAAKINANYQAGFAKMQAELDETNAQIEANRQKTEEARAAMVALDATQVNPVVNAENIDALINKLRAASSEMNRLNGGATPVAPDTKGPDGRRARGGPISRGASYLVGERGPELITASRSGYVNTAAQTASMGGASITISPSFSFTNTTAADAAEIEARTREALRREVREMFRGVFADTSTRFA